MITHPLQEYSTENLDTAATEYDYMSFDLETTANRHQLQDIIKKNPWKRSKISVNNSIALNIL